MFAGEGGSRPGGVREVGVVLADTLATGGVAGLCSMPLPFRQACGHAGVEDEDRNSVVAAHVKRLGAIVYRGLNE